MGIGVSEIGVIQRKIFGIKVHRHSLGKFLDSQSANGEGKPMQHLKEIAAVTTLGENPLVGFLKTFRQGFELVPDFFRF